MSEFAIEVEGGSSVRLSTAGKYCDRDIVVTATGGGQKIYIAPSGAMYTAIYANDPNFAEVGLYNWSSNLFRNAAYLEEATFYKWPNIVSTKNNNPVTNNPLLKRLHLPDFRASGIGCAYNNTYIVESGCPNLTDVTLGKIGTPVVGTVYNNALAGAKSSDLVITVYVDANTLTDAKTITGNQPWGATNATVVYRNSTTGEVITE